MLMVSMAVLQKRLSRERARVLLLDGAARILRPWTKDGEEYIRFNGGMTVLAVTETNVHAGDCYWEVYKTAVHKAYMGQAQSLDQAQALADQTLLTLGYKLLNEREALLL